MSSEFVAAAASWFGMDPDRLADAHMTSNAHGITVHFKVKLEADDYLGIADRMRAMREPERDPRDNVIEDGLGGWKLLPTLQEVMRDPVAYMDRPECHDLLMRAAELSSDAKAKLMFAMAQSGKYLWKVDPSPGAESRAVQHIDAPVEEESSALPAAVWLSIQDITEMQKQMASDVRGPADALEFLIQVAMLTPEQLAKANGSQS